MRVRKHVSPKRMLLPYPSVSVLRDNIELYCSLSLTGSTLVGCILASTTSAVVFVMVTLCRRHKTSSPACAEGIESLK